MKNVYRNFGLAILFLVSFGLFLYLSFPYGVLKEALASQIQMTTGIRVRIEELGPAIPLGFKATGVEILGAGGAKVSLSKVKASISILQIFLLNAGINIDIEANNKGYLELGVGVPILSLFSGKDILPSYVDVEAKSFPLDGIVSYALKTVANSESAAAVAGPMIAALGFKGNLDGTIKLNLDTAALPKSTGQVALKINNASLILSDPSIALPDQVFKSALVKADLSGGSFKIDPSSRFTADELEFGADGKIGVKQNIGLSDMDLKIMVKLSGGLNEKLGWVMDGLSGGASKGGLMNLQLAGSLAQPVVKGSQDAQ
ncbi:MAG: type II secretion system protein GspN [Proteobacteria bacterium]|nr:type II secretion system protein GspN [Pseudomonadota bacterium]